MLPAGRDYSPSEIRAQKERSVPAAVDGITGRVQHLRQMGVREALPPCQVLLVRAMPVHIGHLHVMDEKLRFHRYANLQGRSVPEDHYQI